MKTSILAALSGLCLGIANFIGFQTKLSEGRASGASASRIRLWMFLAWFDLIAFPVIGYFLPTIFKWAE